MLINLSFGGKNMRKNLFIVYLILIQFGGFFGITQVFSNDCKDLCEAIAEDADPKEFFKKNLEIMENDYKSIKATIVLVEKQIANPLNLLLPTHLTAKIVFDSANLVNTISKITQSKHLKGFDDPSLCKLLCKSSDFISRFSESLISEPKNTSLIDVFRETISGDWFKNGMADLDFCIKTLVKYANQDDSYQAITSYLPLIKTTYRELTDTVCRLLKVDNEVFANDIMDLVDYIKNFKQVMSNMENDTYLIENKDMEKIKPIIISVKKLQGYFTHLSSKIDDVLQETNFDMGCSEVQSDAFTQEIMHVIFIYKHNKLDYKQMNNEVSKLITMIKSFQAVKK